MTAALGKAMSRTESDTAPLRRADSGSPPRTLLVYTDDNWLGCAGWCCCATVSPTRARLPCACLLRAAGAASGRP